MFEDIFRSFTSDLFDDMIFQGNQPTQGKKSPFTFDLFSKMNNNYSFTDDGKSCTMVYDYTKNTDFCESGKKDELMISIMKIWQSFAELLVNHKTINIIFKFDTCELKFEWDHDRKRFTTKDLLDNNFEYDSESGKFIEISNKFEKFEKTIKPADKLFHIKFDDDENVEKEEPEEDGEKKLVEDDELDEIDEDDELDEIDEDLCYDTIELDGNLASNFQKKLQTEFENEKAVSPTSDCGDCLKCKSAFCESHAIEHFCDDIINDDDAMFLIINNIFDDKKENVIGFSFSIGHLIDAWRWEFDDDTLRQIYDNEIFAVCDFCNIIKEKFGFSAVSYKPVYQIDTPSKLVDINIICMF